MKRKLLLTLFAAIITTSLSFAQDSSTSYRASLKQMMQLAGSEGAYKGAVNQMITLFKQQQPKVPAAFWDEFSLEMNKIAFDEIIDMVLPVYQKHLTEDDLKGIIAFYKTPAGQKFAAQTPAITQESMAAGQEWGKKLGEKVIKQLQDKGYLNKQ